MLETFYFVIFIVHAIRRILRRVKINEQPKTLISEILKIFLLYSSFFANQPAVIIFRTRYEKHFGQLEQA